jgi:hypothetical protein
MLSTGAIVPYSVPVASRCLTVRVMWRYCGDSGYHGADSLCLQRYIKIGGFPGILDSS